MKNPLLLILISTRNRGFHREAGTRNLLNEDGNMDKKGSNDVFSITNNPEATSNQSTDIQKDADGTKGNVYYMNAPTRKEQHG